jgi:hypothetical protein
VVFGGDEHWADQQASVGGGKVEKTRLPVVAPSTPTSPLMTLRHIGDEFYRPGGVRSAFPAHAAGYAS